ncbi:MAG: molybdopterin-dependent oxidoreductase [Williamsia sp.]|nr:molybdopterin-dependent oxidoreductase [Williamsia sp.]
MKKIFPFFKSKGPRTQEDLIRRKTIGSFLLFFLLIALAIFGWMQLRVATPGRLSDGVQKPLRKVLDVNEKIFNRNFSTQHLSKTYPVSAADKKVRVNGDVGMSDDFDPASWKLQLVKASGDTLLLTLDDLKKLPKTEIVFDFKCIEGWSQITHWGGVRFQDFVKAYHLEKEASMKYIGMHTPDEEYYVGIDMPSALHPQTLLCYEMNGKPLPLNQGQPLRMIIPVKYGIKSLKRIGTLFFSESRPPDYWFERGYDYYAGL